MGQSGSRSTVNLGEYCFCFDPNFACLPVWCITHQYTSKLSAEMAQKLVDEKISNNKVVVFSKTYCPYCKMAKDVLNQTGVKFDLLELDERGL